MLGCNENEYWELTLLDADPEVQGLGCLAAADIDGDGNVEVITGGEGKLLWYRPETREKGIIDNQGQYGVGVALEDIDGDGIMEIFATGIYDDSSGKYITVCYKSTGGMNGEWVRTSVDPEPYGHAHDLLFADIDGDGENELVANAAYCSPWALYIYKKPDDLNQPWQKHTLQAGFAEEGLAVGDITGNSKLDIVSGTGWYEHPEGDPMSEPWKQHKFAEDFREMVRVACVDITGNGRSDIIVVDSEFVDGNLSWYENRVGEDPDNPMKEHRLDSGLNFAHSLAVRKEGDAVSVFVGEMQAGGWGQPYNHDARLIEYRTSDKGKTWKQEILYKGTGTHQALICDVDNDGEDEIIGKIWARHLEIPCIQIWKRTDKPSPIDNFGHVFIDRDKPFTGIDITAADVYGSGNNDIICGQWWYRNPDWKRYGIPDIFQVINAYDIDGDGRQELIALKEKATDSNDFYPRLCSDLVWIKPIDPENGEWEEYEIGMGSGDWPHGNLTGPYGPSGETILICGYHDAHNGGGYPEYFTVPEDPKAGPWEKHILMEKDYGEEFTAADIDGDGQMEIIAGPYILKSDGKGGYNIHTVIEDFYPARLAIMDVNGNGFPDIVYGREVMDYPEKHVPYSPVVWCENPGTLDGTPWKKHVIDNVMCAHSIGVADIDGDGQMEIVVGEHMPFKPYRSRCRTYVYKQADPEGIAWKRYTLDGRFEHHDGTKPIDLGGGQIGIMSHAWQESKYVHLWKPK